MTIRLASIEDAPLVYNLVNKFITNSPYNNLLRDNTKLEREIHRILESPKDLYITLLSSNNKGILCIGITELPFNQTKIAHEIVWYSEGYSKDFVLMFQAAEFWAKKVGAEAIQFSSLSSSPESVDRFYEKNDYQLTEKAFIKWVF